MGRNIGLLEGSLGKTAFCFNALFGDVRQQTVPARTCGSLFFRIRAGAGEVAVSPSQRGREVVLLLF